MGKVTILGGRMHRLLPHIVDHIGALYQAGETCLLLVPEQYTLQAEVELIRRLHLPGFFRIQVLSPSRLTQRIFDAAGTDGRVPLDGRGKQMALSRAILQVQKQLTFYRRSAAHVGLVEKIGSLIADFKRGRLTAESMLTHADALPSGALKHKLQDIALCWEAYENQLSGRFVDGEDVQAEAARRLPESGLFDGTYVFAYGFDILSPQLCELLCAGTNKCAGMTVALTMDRPKVRDSDLFIPTRKSAQRLSRMLKNQGTEYEWTYLPFTSHASTPDIAHLETELFARWAIPYPFVPESVSLYDAPNPYAEAHEAAAQMLKLYESGIPWSEIAVAAGSIQDYASILSAVLPSYGIPVHLEEKMPVSSHGLIRFLLHALRAVSKGYPKADVIACLKSGYAPLKPEDCYRLENYALANGIYGDRWRKPFARGKKEEAEKLEPVRQAFIGPMETLREALLKAKEATDSLRAIFHFLEEVDAYHSLQTEEELLLQMNLPDKAAKTRQIWQFLLGTLDQMHELLSGLRAPSTQVAAWLSAGFSAGNLNALPPVQNTVVCGDIGHIMPGSIKALFVLGLGDGLLQSGSQSLLMDEEREQLEILADTNLGQSGKGRDQLALNHLKQTLTIPTQRLFLSYAQATQSGQSQRPASFISLLKTRLFPLMEEAGGVTGLSGPQEPLAPIPALDGLALRLSALWDGISLEEALPKEWLEAWAALYQNPKTQQKAMQIISALNDTLNTSPLERETALKLFGHETMSVSRLEEYAQCPYKHFVHYGLRPVERKEWTLTSADVGTYFHSALKNFTEKASQHETWPEISRSECEQIMDIVLSPMEQEWVQGPLGENAQTAALGKKYTRIIRRAAWMFTQHMKSSSFKPRMAEVGFGTPGSLLPPIRLQMKDGLQVLLRGVIDRIDLYEDEKSVYLQVVDYKSGNKDLEPTQLYYGLQLQLMLYLMAALQAVPNAAPAGAFYFHIDDPLADLDSDMKEQAEQQIAQMLRLKGVVLSDATVVELMDKDGVSLKQVFTKSGTLTAYASAASLVQMHELIGHAARMAQSLASAMREGAIAISPVRIKAFSACQWCDYAGICRWDSRLNGAKPRFLQPLSFQELMEKLDQDPAN